MFDYFWTNINSFFSLFFFFFRAVDFVFGFAFASTNISHEFPVIVSSLVLNPSSLMRVRTKVAVDENGFLDCQDTTFARLVFHKHSCHRNYLWCLLQARILTLVFLNMFESLFDHG